MDPGRCANSVSRHPPQTKNSHKSGIWRFSKRCEFFYFHSTRRIKITSTGAEIYWFCCWLSTLNKKHTKVESGDLASTADDSTFIPQKEPNSARIGVEICWFCCLSPTSNQEPPQMSNLEIKQDSRISKCPPKTKNEAQQFFFKNSS